MTMQKVRREVTFKCAGCGKVHEAKALVPVAEVRSPLAVPQGWGNLEITGQHNKLGAIAILLIAVCSEPCGEKFMEAAAGPPGNAMEAQVQADVLAYVRKNQQAATE